MFLNIYLKRILSSLRDKETLIWTWAFPLLMATLFFFTFSGLDSANQLKVVPVAVVENDGTSADPAFRQVLDAVSREGENQLFAMTKVTDAEHADTLLKEGKIDAYLTASYPPVLTVKEDGINQTIVKTFLDNYLQTRAAAEAIIRQSPSAGEELAELFGAASFTKEISLTKQAPTEKVNYFYALLAMVCLYGGFQGLRSISMLQANLSAVGARQTMAPVGRFRLIVYDLFGGITVHFGCLLVVVAYITLVLGIGFGDNLWLVLLTCLVGSLVGVSFGALVSVTSRFGENAKVAILICVTLLCSFLSGLMVSGINYIIAQNIPILAWINPAARITDAFYCLYYYDTLDRYFFNIGVLLMMAAVLLLSTTFFVRRQRYESI